MKINKCKMCGATITGKEFVAHRKMNEVLGLKLTDKGSLTHYCGKCLRKVLDMYDALNAPQAKYDWRGRKAKLNYDKIMIKKLKLDSRYVDFVERHKDDEFTLGIREESSNKEELARQLIAGLYMFNELPEMIWNFHVSELEII